MAKFTKYTNKYIISNKNDYMVLIMGLIHVFFLFLFIVTCAMLFYIHFYLFLHFTIFLSKH